MISDTFLAVDDGIETPGSTISVSPDRLATTPVDDGIETQTSIRKKLEIAPLATTPVDDGIETILRSR